MFASSTAIFFDVLQLPFVARRSARPRSTQIDIAGADRDRGEQAFGTDDVVGQTLTADHPRQERATSRHRRVRGPAEEQPHASSSLVARFDPATFNADQPSFLTCWGCQNGWVYVKLRPGRRRRGRSTASFPPGRSATSPTNAGGAQINAGDDQDWQLVNVRDVHLGEAQDGAMTPGNDRRTIVTFAIVALLILGMAVVNFTNLATARASQRAREVALRKVLGAEPQAADRPVPRRIDAGRRRSRCCSRWRMVELLLPLLRRLPRCRPRASPISARAALLLPVARAGAGRRRCRRPLSGFLSVALPAGRGAQGQQVARPRRRAPAGCATSSSSPSSRSRSGSSSAPRSSTRQTVYARTADPGYKRDGLIQVEDLAARQVAADGRDADRARSAQVDGVEARRPHQDRRRHRQQQQ